MKTKVLNAEKENKKKLISEVVGILQQKGIVVLPTDTVYGVMTSIFNQEGQKTIYKLKNRNDRKPLILLSHNVDLIKQFVVFPKKIEEIIKDFWPGQLTLILSTTEIGKILTGGRDNLGVRIPNCKILLDIMKLHNLPLMSTSANISGKESAKDAKSALKYFNNKVNMIVDDGKCKFSFESTVIDMVKFPYVVIRKGCLDCNKLLKYI
ncbi:MAG: L-threonylcarbamoyladenylate synthase [Endomicrobiaceae bacterium]|nr:L-threonylcarbamoyladenylate synthase [Endomicrobiaceae bacterium]